MNKQQLIAQIASTAQVARDAGQSVTINPTLPTVSVYRGEGDEFFFQEHEADDLLTQARETLDNLIDEEDVAQIGEEEVILHQAQGW